MDLVRLGSVAMGQPNNFSVPDEEPKENSFWICVTVFLFTCAFTLFSFWWPNAGFCSKFGDGWLLGAMWPDHFDYAAKLNERLDVAEETIENLSAKAAVSEEETAENINSLEGSVWFGFMEYGGFVRNETLDWQQRSHMPTQECGNFVVWNFRNGAGKTDPPWMVRKLEKMMKTCMRPLEVQRPCWITCAQTRVLHCFKNIGWRQIKFNKQPSDWSMQPQVQILKVFQWQRWRASEMCSNGSLMGTTETKDLTSVQKGFKFRMYVWDMSSLMQWWN